MTIEQYKFKIRMYRGKLTSVDDHLNLIYRNATQEMLDWTLSSKALGIKKIAYAVSIMDPEEQKEFVKWVTSKKRKVSEIDTYLLNF